MKKIYLIVILLLGVLSIGCEKKEYSSYDMDVFAMGSYIKISIYSQEKVDDKVFERMENAIRDVDHKMSINDKNVESEVDNINEKAGTEFVNVSKETFELIERGIKYSKETNENLDIAIGPVVKLWNIGFEDARLPDDLDIKNALSLVDIDKISLNKKESSIMLKQKGMMIDLGAIAKGYVGEKLKSIILDSGYKHAVLNIGGNILCIGEKVDSSPYKVGIRDGKKSKNDVIGALDVANKSVVTSGIYERNFVNNGKLYHHILDRKTGYPVENNLQSVSIISDDSTYCDALSTAIFSMGLDKGLEYVNDKSDVEAIFVTKDNKVYLTSGIKGKFKLTSEEYNLQP